MRLSLSIVAIAAFGVVASGLVSCRGGTSEKPPIHLVLDMDFQPKLRAQSESSFEGWSDKRGARLPVEGTIARESLRDARLTTFKNADDTFVAQNPIALDADVMARGRQRYDIFCAPCHGRSAMDKGLVGKRWPAPIPSLATDPRLVAMTDGELYSTITNGKNTMPPYARQIAVEDRWKIVHYLRALQKRAN